MLVPITVLVVGVTDIWTIVPLLPRLDIFAQYIKLAFREKMQFPFSGYRVV
jgi:hypothetical protein